MAPKGREKEMPKRKRLGITDTMSVCSTAATEEEAWDYDAAKEETVQDGLEAAGSPDMASVASLLKFCKFDKNGNLICAICGKQAAEKGKNWLETVVKDKSQRQASGPVCKDWHILQALAVFS